MITLLIGIIVGVIVSLVGSKILSSSPEDVLEADPGIVFHRRELSRIIAEMQLSKRNTTSIDGQRIFWLFSTQGRYLSDVNHKIITGESGRPEVRLDAFTVSNVEVCEVSDIELLKLIKTSEVTALENKELISVISEQFPQLKLHEVVVNEKTDITVGDYKQRKGGAK